MAGLVFLKIPMRYNLLAQNDVNLKVVGAAIAANDHQIKYCFSKLVELCNGNPITNPSPYWGLPSNLIRMTFGSRPH